jgi:hypothetical protein
MLSLFVKKDNDSLAVERALSISEDLLANDIGVVRVKVEGHNAVNTPQTNKDYFIIKNYLKNKYNNKCGIPYFEFHVKVLSKLNASMCYKQLEKDIKLHSGTAISYNLCSATKHPLLTIRVYEEGFIQAKKYKDKVLTALNKKGYILDTKIQQEFSIYDTNARLDTGWLKNILPKYSNL